MANIEFTKTALRVAVEKSCDLRIAAATQERDRQTDKAILRERRAEWRETCVNLMRDMADRMESGDVTNEDISEFEFPRQPTAASGYTLNRLSEAVDNAVTRKERLLSRVEAMNNDKITLTPKQLADYFGI